MLMAADFRHIAAATPPLIFFDCRHVTIYCWIEDIFEH